MQVVIRKNFRKGYKKNKLIYESLCFKGLKLVFISIVPASYV